MKPKDLILYDRSGVELDWRCPRAFYHNRIYGGRGIVPRGVDEDLLLGTAIHDTIGTTIEDGGSPTTLEARIERWRIEMLERFLHHPPARGEIADLEAYAAEFAALTEGLIRGWWRLVYPRLQLQYELTHVEAEIPYERDGTLMQTKPDLLLRELQTELRGYLEWKTTALLTPEWFDGWNYAAQLQAGAAAVKQTMGFDIDFVVVQALHKGSYKDGWRHSPFCYCWTSTAGPKDFDKGGIAEAVFDEAENRWYSAVYQRGARWERISTLAIPHGLAWWVEQMPSETLNRQFPMTPPIFINPTTVESFFRQTIPRVIKIEDERRLLKAIVNDYPTDYEHKGELINQVLDRAFPQRTTQCVPAIGRRCQFHRICHSPIGSDPIGSGYFEQRTPHHQAERDRYGIGSSGEETPRICGDEPRTSTGDRT